MAIFFSQHGLPLAGRLSTVPVSHNFVNIMVCQVFFQEIHLSTSLLFIPQIQTFFIKILSLLLNTMLIVDKHCSDICCDKFLRPQIDRKKVKEQ